MLSALLLIWSVPAVLALLTWTNIFAFSFGAYALHATLPVWVVLLAVAVTPRVFYLKLGKARWWFVPYAAAEAAIVVTSCVSAIANRQPDVFPLVIAMTLTVSLLSVTQLGWVLRRR